MTGRAGRLALDLLRFHPQGMHRVASVIDGNPDYDVLLGRRLDGPEWSVLRSSGDSDEMRQAALALFEAKLRQGPSKVFLPACPGICCDGGTANNRREFAFFERLTNIRLFNYSDSGSRPALVPEAELEEARRLLIADAREFFENRSSLSAAIVHQQILYSRTLLDSAVAFSDPDSVKPAALVQANDHSAARVALSMVMKALGVPRVYLQHAEVTNHFPPLDFEYSVLRNRQSLRTYEQIGPIAGRVYILSRHDEPFARSRLQRPREEPVTVVIYPTSRIRGEQLKDVVAALSSNPFIARVLIKAHPASRAADFASLDAPGVRLIKDIPAEDHVALVGNSAVAIELLHFGIPVYQNFDFDPIAPDYYGFVRRGLTKHVPLQALSGAFWTPYDVSAEWLAAYAELDPSVDGTHEQDQQEFVAEMKRLAGVAGASASRRSPSRQRGPVRGRLRRLARDLLARSIHWSPRPASRVALAASRRLERLGRHASELGDHLARFVAAHTRSGGPNAGEKSAGAAAAHESHGRQDTFKLVEYTLAEVDNPGHWMQLNERAGAIPPLIVVDVLETLFQGRAPVLRKILDATNEWPDGSAAGTWTYLRKVMWSNRDIGAAELSDIARFVYTYSGAARMRARLEHLLLQVILRSGSCTHLDEFWSRAREVRRESLPPNRRIELIRRLRMEPGREAEARQEQAAFEAQASAFELLKFRTMDVLEGRGVPGWGHAEAEAEFAATAPSSLSREYEAYLKPVYDALRTRMPFMDVRTNREAAKELVSLIERALDGRRPFSLIRLGDGEGYLFPDGPFFRAEDRRNRERHWWGIELTVERRDAIIAEARRAVAEADVVGIPAIYRFIRDHGDRSYSLTQTIQGRGLLQALHEIAALAAPQTLMAEDRVNVALFSDVDAVLSLAGRAEHVVIVSSVRPECLPDSIRGFPCLTTIGLPTHSRTSLNDRYVIRDEVLPLVYSELLQQLEPVTTPGALVLVAGGIIGKVFVGRARELGAVALDIGSVLDDWIGGGLRTLR